jgi:hypothetical protein
MTLLVPFAAWTTMPPCSRFLFCSGIGTLAPPLRCEATTCLESTEQDAWRREVPTTARGLLWSAGWVPQEWETKVVLAGEWATGAAHELVLLTAMLDRSKPKRNNEMGGLQNTRNWEGASDSWSLVTACERSDSFCFHGITSCLDRDEMEHTEFFYTENYVRMINLCSSGCTLQLLHPALVAIAMRGILVHATITPPGLSSDCDERYTSGSVPKQ